MLMVVTYDVADDRRRVRLHTFLLGYGDAVQESVFECHLDDRQENALKRGVRRLVRSPADQVRYYRLCAECVASIEDVTGHVSRAEPPLHWV